MPECNVCPNATRSQELKGWFDFLDKDGSGEITVEELEDPLISMGLAKNRAQVEALIQKVDWDGSGNIGFAEFMDIITAKDDDGGNPIVEVYKALSKGKLGDRCLHIETLITSYRRQLLMQGLLSRGQTHTTDKDQAEAKRLQHHVNALEISMKYADAAREAHHKEVEAEKQHALAVADVDAGDSLSSAVEEQIALTRRRVHARERKRDALRERHTFHIDDFDVFRKSKNAPRFRNNTKPMITVSKTPDRDPRSLLKGDQHLK